MKSEDITRYVAGLKAEVERIREEVGLRSAYGDTPISYIRELERDVTDLKAEVERPVFFDPQQEPRDPCLVLGIRVGPDAVAVGAVMAGSDPTAIRAPLGLDWHRESPSRPWTTTCGLTGLAVIAMTRRVSLSAINPADRCRICWPTPMRPTNPRPSKESHRG